MSAHPSLAVRCPRCGAHVRAGADWCTLCYTDLRAAPEPPPAPVPLPGTPAPEPAAAVAPASPRGRHARQAPAYDERDAPADGDHEPAPGTDAMLAMLAAESGRPFDGLLDRFDSTGARVGAMVGGVVVVSVGLFALMYLVGSLL